mgnify:CR=1 FL=1
MGEAGGERGCGGRWGVLWVTAVQGPGRGCLGADFGEGLGAALWEPGRCVGDGEVDCARQLPATQIATVRHDTPPTVTTLTSCPPTTTITACIPQERKDAVDAAARSAAAAARAAADVASDAAAYVSANSSGADMAVVEVVEKAFSTSNTK